MITLGSSEKYIKKKHASLCYNKIGFSNRRSMK